MGGGGDVWMVGLAGERMVQTCIALNQIGYSLTLTLAAIRSPSLSPPQPNNG